MVRASLELMGTAGRAAETEAAHRWEDEALRQVDRLDTMVDSILASLRVLREEPPKLEPVDVAAVVEATIASLGAILRRHPLGAEFLERPLMAVGSAALLGRLLEYLLENAAKYAPTGGRISLYGWRDGGRALLAVTDDGPAIAEWRKRIFELFVGWTIRRGRRDSASSRPATSPARCRVSCDSRTDCPAGSQFVLELAALT